MRKRLKLTLPSSNCNDPWVCGSGDGSEGNDVAVQAVDGQIIVSGVDRHQRRRRAVRELHLDVKQPLLESIIVLRRLIFICLRIATHFSQFLFRPSRASLGHSY